MKSRTLYIVSIPHREPTYELHSKADREEPYVTQFEVVAENPEEAEEFAKERFEQLAEESLVRWHRVIDKQGITVLKKGIPLS